MDKVNDGWRPTLCVSVCEWERAWCEVVHKKRIYKYLHYLKTMFILQWQSGHCTLALLFPSSWSAENMCSHCISSAPSCSFLFVFPFRSFFVFILIFFCCSTVTTLWLLWNPSTAWNFACTNIQTIPFWVANLKCIFDNSVYRCDQMVKPYGMTCAGGKRHASCKKMRDIKFFNLTIFACEGPKQPDPHEMIFQPIIPF